MSKAQGDGFKTWTNQELNAYRKRLNDRLRPMVDETHKWYDIGDGFWILAESWNELDNPNGSWKWHGWRIIGRKFKLQVYDEDCLDLTGDEPQVAGCSIVCKVFDDRDEANRFFQTLRA